MYIEVKTAYGTIRGEIIESSLLGVSVIRTSSGEIYERYIDGKFYRK
ncbi:hypothetical protein [Arcicella lustrica]|uniref:Uncharacterized protein n=1 Tax=Arcicella lustrica TaxID=2984196 RepID=A0ABU5SGG5_9BACT|nr:hypothetical protein [Arcicella sp. DC25W]MEA5426391.1 hypothetical protein [Arcicella sp. DC25W]